MGRYGKNCLANDELVVEIRVKITKVAGIEVYLRKFNDEECSDVALVVDGKKFYVSKLYLASQSSYFKSMFLGKFDESGKSEIKLTDIKGYDLQKYLEMLYGEDALDDETVCGILHLADMYDTSNLIGRCEGYLLEISEKTLKRKLELSARYNLNELKEKCMSEIKTIDDVRSVIPERVHDMDHTIRLYPSLVVPWEFSGPIGFQWSHRSLVVPYDFSGPMRVEWSHESLVVP